MNELAQDRSTIGFGVADSLYGVALVAVCFLVFGLIGFLIALWIVLVRRQRGATLMGVLLTSVILGSMLGSIPPTGTRLWDRWDRRSANNRWAAIQDIAFAVKQHRRRSGAYPTDWSTTDGKSLSWRTDVLERLEGREYLDYFGVDETWNGNNTQELIDEPPDSVAYLYRADRYIVGSYFAITGVQTAWSKGLAKPDYLKLDYRSEDVLLVEANCNRVGVEWYEAGDLTSEAAVALLCERNTDEQRHPNIDYGWLWRTTTARHVALADGRVLRLHCPLSTALAEALVDTNKNLDWRLRWELELATWRPLDYRVGIGWPLLVLVATWPRICYLFGLRRENQVQP